MKFKLEDELCGAQKEKEQQEGQLLDKICMQPRVLLHRAGVSEDHFGPERQVPELPGVKEEEKEPPGGKEEEQLKRPNIKIEAQQPTCIKEEGHFTELPVTGVHAKTEDEDGQYEEKKGAELPRSSSNQHGTTYVDGEHRGGSQADSWLAPITDSDDTMSHSSHPNDDEDWEGEMPCHTDSKRWKCSQCEKTFAYKCHLKRHVKGHTGEKPFACSVCGKRFTFKEYLKSHARTHTGEKPYTCSICGERFSQHGILRRHRQTHTGEKPFACSVCGKRFSQKGNLKQHTQTHTDSSLAPMSDGDGAKFLSRNTNDGEAWEGDIPCHTDFKPWKCSQCGKTFAFMSLLKSHRMGHVGEKPFACLVCGKRFTFKKNLKPHTRTHTGEKPYACSICGKRFSQNTNLRRHVQKHTGETPFACSVCGKKFTSKENLKSHTRTHTGEKPFACSVCGKKFSLNGNLKKHTQTHADSSLATMSDVDTAKSLS